MSLFVLCFFVMWLEVVVFVVQIIDCYVDVFGCVLYVWSVIDCVDEVIVFNIVLLMMDVVQVECVCFVGVVVVLIVVEGDQCIDIVYDWFGVYCFVFVV